MAEAFFVGGGGDAQTSPWTPGVYTSRLSSTPGTRELGTRAVLLLDWLQTKAAETSLPKNVWLFRRSRFSFNFEADGF